MNNNRRLFSIALKPMIGDRFQPTGFPNLGHAEFWRPRDTDDWTRCLLVESEQSMANRLEAALWDLPKQEPAEAISGLPHMRVVGMDDRFLTSSRLEAHRIASAWIRESEADGATGIDIVNERLGLTDSRQRSPHEIASALFGLDPMVLIHGVFLSDRKYPGQPKVSRAVTAFIEASDVREAYGGGVKKDSVLSESREGSGAQEGFGMVPFDRLEWTARNIHLHVDIDHAQIRSYGLPDEATRLLSDIAELQLRRLVGGELRLRTACDLTLVDNNIADHSGEPLRDEDELEDAVANGVTQCASLIEEPLTLTYPKPIK